MTASNPHLSPPIVLTFAASDPSGGAGVQADVMTVSSLGCHSLSVMTAFTVQDTVGIGRVKAVASDWVEDQARTLLQDMSVAAFKIGLVGSIENIVAIAEIVADYPDVPLVLDPVLASGRGDGLVDDEMISGLREFLMPLTTVLTPNSLEARRLADDDGGEERPLFACAQRLLDFGCEYVLLTGTHEDSVRVINTLYRRRIGVVRRDGWDRLAGSYHGSGCTLASAIAAGLAGGLSVEDAVRKAQDYTWRSLAAGFKPGTGQFIPDRFFQFRKHNGGVDG